MRIALDAMGTDRHPTVEVEGAVEALRELPEEVEVVLVGDRETVEREIARHEGFPRERLSVVHASEVVTPGEAPATAVRRKQDSSIVVGLTLQREGKADAFVSAGSTGAVMAASLFILRPLPGVDRPAVATMLPAREPVLMLDAGANVDSKPHHLLQFAHLGAIYAMDVMGRATPRIGLLNIGEEPEKGNELAVEAHELLSASGLNFIGNVEGRDVVRGVCDVLVTDGFVGNVLLKFYEAVAPFVYEAATGRKPPAPGEAPTALWKKALDWTTYGGAPLLGVNGVTIICHGGSPPVAIRNAIGVAIQAVQTRMVGHIRQQLGGDLASERRLAEGA